MFGGGIHITCYLRFTSGATPADLLAASLVADLFSTMYLQAGIGGSIGATAHSVRPGRHFTELCWLGLQIS